MNALAKELGLSPDLTFYDVYSLDEPDLLAHIPRPAYALLVIFPLTPAWRRDREAEDAALGDPATYYRGRPASGTGPEPIIWFKQTIHDACGSYGLVHCAVNGPAAKHIIPGSFLNKLRAAALPLGREERAKLLYDSEEFERAHQLVAGLGESSLPVLRNGERLGQHFVAYVKVNGHLWELEGSREGPLDRGELDEGEDVLSPKALARGLKRIMQLDADAGGNDLRFSCIALAPRESVNESA
jgi:ubiquitin carboxyl-terminal hydrolase L3